MKNGQLGKRYNKVFLSLQEVATELGLTKPEITYLVENNALKAEIISNKFKFRKHDVENFINSGNAGEEIEDAVSLYKQKGVSSTIDGGKKMVEGFVTKTGDRFLVQFNLGKDENGKRIRENKTFRTYELAESYRKKRANEFNEVIVNKKYGDYTLKQYAKYYLELNVGNATSRTIAGYASDIKAVLEIIGDTKMTEIKQADVLKTFQNLSERYRKHVLNKKWIITRMILKYATASAHIEKNPSILIKKPKSRVFEAEDNASKAYSDKDLERILTAAEKNKELHTIFRVLLSTGMRPGELRALRWRDFNEKKKTITILSAATRKYDLEDDILESKRYTETIQITKSKCGFRTLLLSENAVETLKAWRDYLDNFEMDQKRNSVYIFSGPDGELLKESTLSGKITRFVKENNLGDIKVNSYKFRHTMCTRLVLLGVHQEAILKILGDKTGSLITEVYSHVSQDNIKDFSNKLFNSSDIF